jgi:hypothetical protein
MDATKPYEFIGFGVMDVTKPYEFIGIGAMKRTKMRSQIARASARAVWNLIWVRSH